MRSIEELDAKYYPHYDKPDARRQSSGIPGARASN
jgi:hypothetical protein